MQLDYGIELFVDDLIIDTKRGLKLCGHENDKEAIIIRCDDGYLSVAETTIPDLRLGDNGAAKFHIFLDSLYPYIPPDYEVPFLHIGTQKQLLLDNFVLDHLDGVKRVFPKPDRPAEPIIRTKRDCRNWGSPR